MCVQPGEPETQILCGTMVPEQVAREKAGSPEKEQTLEQFSRDSSQWK